jgi:hypothetical protein
MKDRWPALSTADGLSAFLEERSNWGRWGEHDEVGAINLITAGKRVEAARVVRDGIAVSLARPIATEPGIANPRPAQHYLTARPRGAHAGAGYASDYVGLYFHGRATTHIDGLCHNWGERGMWNNRSAQAEISFEGFRSNGIENWKDGILTRGVLFDVPAFRGTDYVTMDHPVTGRELDAIAERYELDPRAGDAIVVYSGREHYSAVNGWWGTNRTVPTDGGPAEEYRPGLHPSCLGPLRDWDASVLVWDMMDHEPDPLGLPWGVHAALFAFGIALVDNAVLQELAETCARLGRYEFLLTVNPLHLRGGTGCPVNPVAVL